MEHHSVRVAKNDNISKGEEVCEIKNSCELIIY